MDLTLTLPDALAARVLDALAADGGWVDVATHGPKAAFARQRLRALVREVVIRHELAAARVAAEAAETASYETAQAARLAAETAIAQARADRAVAIDAARAALETEVDLG